MATPTPMPRNEIVGRLERYVDDFHLPARFGVRALSVQRTGDGGYLVTTDSGTITARNVVMATGLFQRPKKPPFSAQMPQRITQLHSGRYRNPGLLPSGSVLVVGSAQSGCQITQELYQSGRRVYLCVGSAGRIPRRYRGRDITEWLNLMGFFDALVYDLPSPKAKFAANPHLSGRDGGRTLNLHRFARDGVVLLGHLRGVDDGTIQLASDLKESLAKVDRFEADAVRGVDDFIRLNGLAAPSESLPVLRHGYESEEITDLDLTAAGITTIIWAMGYAFDFSLVQLPVLDCDGYPIQKRGVTEYPGLFFVGLPWLYKRKSGLLAGVGEDAEFIASTIAATGHAP